MKVLQKYVAGEVIRATLLVLTALLAMQAFFDLMGELKSIGRGGYEMQHALLYILLGTPGFAYEMMPLAALIGTIWALSQLASRSEFTIMRVSSLSTAMAAWMLAKIGLLFVLVTFVFGEILSPWLSDVAEQMKLQAQGTTISQEFRSGLWARDVIKENGITGRVIGSRFINVAEVGTDGELRKVKLYEFDNGFRLSALVTAAKARYKGNHSWTLSEVSETRFPNISLIDDASLANLRASIVTTTVAERELPSEITPDIMAVLFTDPNRMSANDLKAYTRHLQENKQKTERYEIAFWKKLIYPFAALVMMALALPFAYLQVRSGGVSLKIFSGIMIGVAFYLVNSLFSHVGLLNTWPAFATAVAPSLLFLLIAIGAIMWVEKH